jgi:hypothetical protein
VGAQGPQGTQGPQGGPGATTAAGVSYDDAVVPKLSATDVQAALDHAKTLTLARPVWFGPTLGGKPAVQRISPAGQLWLICFGTGGTPSKPYGVEVYDVTTDPSAPRRLLFWSASTPAPVGPVIWYNAYVIKFVGTTMFLVNGGYMVGATPTVANQFRAVDTTIPTAPANVGLLTMPVAGAANAPFDFGISSDKLTACIACQGTGGLVFADITNPAAMTEFAGARVTQALLPASQWAGVDTSLWPYVVASDYGNGVLRIYDATNVRTNVPPTLIGSLPLNTGIRRVTVDPITRIAYVQLKTTQQIAVVDLATNIAAPTVFSYIPFPGATSDELVPRIVHRAGRVLMISCTSCASPGRVETWDVTVPAAPTFVRYLESAQSLFDLAIGPGDYTYVSNRGGEQELVAINTNALYPV